MKSKDLLEKLDMYEMANLFSTDTGVSGATIWVSTKGRSRHGPRVKVSKGGRAKAMPDFSVDFDGKVVAGKLSISNREFEQVQLYIQVNRDELIKLWNGDMSFVEYVQNHQKV